jgi:hypothetical protein
MGKYLLLSIDCSYRLNRQFFLSLITNQSNNTRENGKVPFVVDRWQLQTQLGSFFIINNQSIQ